MPGTFLLKTISGTVIHFICLKLEFHDTLMFILDILECFKIPSPCSQECTELPGSYQCSCNLDGYKLDIDQSTCIGKSKIINMNTFLLPFGTPLLGFIRQTILYWRVFRLYKMINLMIQLVSDYIYWMSTGIKFYIQNCYLKSESILF